MTLVLLLAAPVVHLGATLLLPTLTRRARPYSTPWRHLVKASGGVYDALTIGIGVATAALLAVDESTRAQVSDALTTGSGIDTATFVCLALLGGVGFYAAVVGLTNRSAGTLCVVRRPQAPVAIVWCAFVAAAEEVLWRLLPLTVASSAFLSGRSTALVVVLFVLGFALLHLPLATDAHGRILATATMCTFALAAFAIAAAATIAACIAFHTAYNLTRSGTALRAAPY